MFISLSARPTSSDHGTLEIGLPVMLWFLGDSFFSDSASAFNDIRRLRSIQNTPVPPWGRRWRRKTGGTSARRRFDAWGMQRWAGSESNAFQSWHCGLTSFKNAFMLYKKPISLYLKKLFNFYVKSILYLSLPLTVLFFKKLFFLDPGTSFEDRRSCSKCRRIGRPWWKFSEHTSFCLQK